MEKKTILIDDKTVSYTVNGKGKVVMLLHGFGEDGTVWQNTVEFLKNSYRVIVPDIPGSGASDLTDDVSMEGIAKVLKAIIEHEAIDRFVLIGHSMGGYATLAFAEKYAGNLSGFGLFHSSAYADNEEKIATRRKGISFIKEHGAKAFLKETAPNLFSEPTKEMNYELVNDFVNGLPAFSNEALIAYYEAMIARPDRTEILIHAKVPVLFVMGQHDKAVPFEDSLKQSTMPAESDICILENSGHMGMLEEPGKSHEALERYLSDLH